jgi:hypothetical protein
VQPTLGHRRCGLLAIELAADGAHAYHAVEPSGLRQLTIGADLPNPYAH